MEPACHSRPQNTLWLICHCFCDCSCKAQLPNTNTNHNPEVVLTDNRYSRCKIHSRELLKQPKTPLDNALGGSGRQAFSYWVKGTTTIHILRQSGACYISWLLFFYFASGKGSSMTQVFRKGKWFRSIHSFMVFRDSHFIPHTYTIQYTHRNWPGWLGASNTCGVRIGIQRNMAWTNVVELRCLLYILAAVWYILESFVYFFNILLIKTKLGQTSKPYGPITRFL